MAGLPSDGIPSTQIDSLNFSGTNVYGATGSFGTAVTTPLLIATTGSFTGIAGTLSSSAGASGTAVDLSFPTAATGSPVTYGLSVQVGAGSLGAGSTAWTVFGKPFAAAPYLVLFPVGATNAGTLAAIAGSIGVGSFYAEKGVASTNFHYIAIGSGRL